MSKPEITWSLMHPTDFDPDYMERVVRRAADYRMDSFEICGPCHRAAGGLDSFLLYEDYPHAAANINRAEILANREKFTKIVESAHSIKRPIYLWHREVMVPNGLLDDLPGLLDANGEFDLLGDTFTSLLRYKLAKCFEAVSGLDGVVLTLTEAHYSVIHNSCKDRYPADKVVSHIVRVFADELAARGKRFILRSFGSIAEDYEDILAGAVIAAQKSAFEVETKITPYDFDPFLSNNPFMRRIPGTTMSAECDCLGEFLGAGNLPSESVEKIVEYVRYGQSKGVDRYAIRLDRVGNSIFDRYEINLYTYERAIDDPAVTADQIRQEWADKHYPPSAKAMVLEMGLAAFDFVEHNNFIDRSVIFHTTIPSMLYIKAGGILSLFKNGIDLHRCTGMWGILFDKRTPGREAILAEKDKAVAIAEKYSRIISEMPREAGYESEYIWRTKLWQNAVIASRAIREFVRCLCAYFDDMKKADPQGLGLRKAVEAAKAEFARLQPLVEAQLKLPSECDGPAGHYVFHHDKDLGQIYLKPFTDICTALLDEYQAEFQAWGKFQPGTVDCVICGAISNDWRCGRYMHASHARLENGLPVRIAGNRVFPNGFIDIEMKRPAAGGKICFYGCDKFARDFVLTLDGKTTRCSFDANWQYELPLAPGGDLVKVRLEKCGSDYPGFHAVVTR